MEERLEQDQVSDLDRLMRDAEATSQRLRRVQIGSTLALVIVFAVSLMAIYGKGRSMYTAENFKASLEPQLKILEPQLEDALRSVVSTVGPHYARLGQERLEIVLPKVATALEADLLGLSTGLAQDAEMRVAAALANVEQTQLEKLHSLYPDLDAARFAEMRNDWAREIQGDTELVLADFQGRVLTDFANLSNTIESFGPNRFDDFEKDELVRYYAHLWLTLIDAEVMSAEKSEVQGG